MKPAVIFIIPALLLALSGCALVQKPLPAGWSARPAACETLFREVDAAVDGSGVRDAAAFPVPGFPYLRSSRFLMALEGRIEGASQKKQWVRWLQELDMQARGREILNLPETLFGQMVENIRGPDKRASLLASLATCSDRLLTHDAAQPDFYDTVGAAVEISDEYSRFMRFVGLYPLASVPVAYLTVRAREKFQKWYDMPMDMLPVAGKIVSYGPPLNAGESAQKTLAGIMAASTLNALNIPRLNGDRQQTVAAALAPVFFQDVAAAYDRIGEMVWRDGRVDVDTTNPTVYYYFSYAFLEEKPVVQVNYVIWFSAREGAAAPWIEQGHLDGLTLRVTLDGDGRPVMVDGINNCGCYHFLIPPATPGLKPRPKPFSPDPFVPQRMPAGMLTQRLGVRISSGWHQAQRLFTTSVPAHASTYRLVPYHHLESLPRGNGSRESLFNGRGIAKNSERMEFLLLFSMGVRSVGEMRQRGHHPVELVGRAHFDDPNLFERYFTYP